MSLLVYVQLKCSFLNEIARAILFHIERTYTIDIYRAIHLVAFIFSLYFIQNSHIYFVYNHTYTVLNLLKWHTPARRHALH